MDLARPIKQLYEMEFFVEAEDHLLDVIFRKFGLDYPFDKAIKVADKILLNTEYRDLMTKNKLRESDFNGVDPLPDRISPWSPVKAKSEMMWRLEKLGVKITK
jgi:hypothetical protein